MRRISMASPVPLVAVGLLLLNDHLFKGSGWVPTGVTGKLSDFAGLFFFPVLLTVLGEWGLARLGRQGSRLWQRLPVAAALTTGVVFGLLKTSVSINSWVNSVWGSVAHDWTDLWALPMSAAAVLWMLHQRRCGERISTEDHHAFQNGFLRGAERVVVVASVFACLATSPTRLSRSYATWHVSSDESHLLGCAEVRAWVAKSGKSGIGATVQLLREPGCQVELRRVEAWVAEALVSTNTIADGAIPAEENVYVYVPLPFHANRAWNRGRRTGVLVLHFTAGVGTLQLPMVFDYGYDCPEPAPGADRCFRLPSPNDGVGGAAPVEGNARLAEGRLAEAGAAEGGAADGGATDGGAGASNGRPRPFPADAKGEDL